MLSFYLTLAVLSARRRYYIVFSIKARPFQINGNYFFYILTTLAFLLKLITAKSKFAHLICLTSLIISPTTDDSGHRSTTFCPRYFDCPTDIKFVLFIFLFYGYKTRWSIYPRNVNVPYTMTKIVLKVRLH